MNQKTIQVAIIAVSIVLSGLLLKMGMDNFTYKDRKVTVKGLSERVVKSDLATWNIHVSLENTKKEGLAEATDKKVKEVKDFLSKAGLADSCITDDGVSISTKTRYLKNKTGEYETVVVGFESSITLSVKTTDTDLVRKIVRDFRSYTANNENVRAGDASYSLKDFQSLKAEMLDEAIINAGKSAEQFAKNSSSTIGKILSADQGTISIEDNDSEYSGSEEYYYVSRRADYMKKVRVVATITYQLVD